jgi:small nuclear ribonucleoprotein (snRNP)-like protein
LFTYGSSLSLPFSIRGSIDAYIVGFDRFWNVLLKDCDEEYIPNHQVIICFAFLFFLMHEIMLFPLEIKEKYSFREIPKQNSRSPKVRDVVFYMRFH